MGRKGRFRRRNCTYSLRVADPDQAGCGDVGRCRGVICAESQHGRAPQGFESSLQCGPLRPLGGEETELLRLCGRWTGTVSGKSSDPRAVFPSERKQEVHGFSDSGKR